jgi:hypothetical protein
MSVEDTIIGLIGGFAISIVTFYIGMQVQQRSERRSFLREHVRQFYPILQELTMELDYGISITLQDGLDESSLVNVSSRITKKLESYKEAYNALRDSGLEPELESSDKNAANELKGLYNLCKLETSAGVPSKFDRYHEKTKVCRNLVESYLKGKWWRV